MTTRSTPRATLFDRHGPDAAILLRAVAWSVAAAFVGIFLGALGASTHGAGTARTLLWAIGAASLGGAGTFALVHGAARGAGAAALAFLQPDGASCPADRQFSLEESLAARGDVAGALASYESMLRAAPSDDAPLRLRAADLYARSGANVERAAQLFRQVQRSPSVSPSDHVYATNRLVTLLLGPLDDRGRAMGELRRLIDRHPGTDVAAGARTALANLKRDLPLDP